MRIYSPDGTVLDVQPSRVGRYLRQGWQREPVTVPDGPVDLDSMTRDQLDEHARAAGVADPDKLPNKDAVKAAIAEQT